MRTALVRSSVVPTTPDRVWERIGTPQGINDELMPWMRMTVPRKMRGVSLSEVAVGQPIGRSWFLLFGLIPFDHDRITIAEREMGRRFLERSTMSSMKRWEHERTLEPAGAQTVLHDRVSFQLRAHLAWIPGLAGLLSAVLSLLFAHRHRRIVRFFSDDRGGPVGRDQQRAPRTERTSGARRTGPALRSVLRTAPVLPFLAVITGRPLAAGTIGQMLMRDWPVPAAERLVVGNHC